MPNWPRAKAGVEDLIFHDTAAGSTTQQMTRKGFGTNPNANVTKISAADIPLLNALLTAVASSRSPWAHLTNKNAEKAIEDNRKHIKNAVNLESVGCTLNDSSTATARINRQVIDSVISDTISATRPKPIYVPPGELYVERPVADGGTVVLPLYDFNAGSPVTPAKLVLIGEPGASTIRSTSNVGAAEDLVMARGPIDLTVQGVHFQLQGASNGRCFVVEDAVASQYSNLRFLDNKFDQGDEGLVTICAAAFILKELWIERNSFINNSVRGLHLRNVRDALARANQFLSATSDAAIFATAGATGEDLLRCLLTQNYLLTGNIKMTKGAGATYDSGLMSYNGAVGNHLVSGNITHSDLNNHTVDGNVLQNGGIEFAMTVAAAIFNGMKCRANQSEGASQDGLQFAVTGGAICHNPQVIGGEYRRASAHGIEMSSTGASSQIRGGTVAGVFCEGNTTDGLRLAAATGGICRGVKVVHNDFVDYQTVPTQDYGFREIGASGTDCNWNLFGHNHTFGNVTGPWLLNGTNSLLDANIAEV